MWGLVRRDGPWNADTTLACTEITEQELWTLLPPQVLRRPRAHSWVCPGARCHSWTKAGSPRGEIALPPWPTLHLAPESGPPH